MAALDKAIDRVVRATARLSVLENQQDDDGYRPDTSSAQDELAAALLAMLEAALSSPHDPHQSPN